MTSLLSLSVGVTGKCKNSKVGFQQTAIFFVGMKWVQEVASHGLVAGYDERYISSGTTFGGGKCGSFQMVHYMVE